MTTPIAEMDGDEMTRILWREIKDELILPFVDLRTEYYDLGLPNRDATSDRVTTEAANAVRRLRVGVKCATITPNAERVEEYGLHEMWRSPNGTIRAILDGTVFRTPIPCGVLKSFIPGWTLPITVARHSYGDIYRDTELRVEGPGTAELVFTAADGSVTRRTVYDFEGPGVLQGCYNKDSSVENFARSCFEYALGVKRDLWFSAKDTIMKQYDGLFKDTFRRLYETEYKERFVAAGITYFYTLIDDAVARLVRSKGGVVWALKNYDGDVMSDMISTAFGSLAMMTSVLVSADGCFEYEAAHGTVTRHYYRRRKGERTSTNPVATIFAWSGALRKRGELDGNNALAGFADALEAAVMETIEDRVVTGDLAALIAHADQMPAQEIRKMGDAARNRVSVVYAGLLLFRTVQKPAPAEHPAFHALRVQHAQSKAFAHQFLGDELVVFLKYRVLLRIDQLQRIEVPFRFLADDLIKLRLAHLQGELHIIRAGGIQPLQPQAPRAAELEEALQRQERVAAQPGEQRPHFPAEVHQRPFGHQRLAEGVPGVGQTADRVGHQIRVGQIFAEHPVHPLQDTGVDIPGHVAEIGGDIALDRAAVHLPALVVHILHDPDAAGDGDLVSHRGRLDNGPELLGARAHGIFHVFPEHGVELIVADDAFTGKPHDQSAVLGALDVADLQKMPEQDAVILRPDPAKTAERQHPGGQLGGRHLAA